MLTASSNTLEEILDQFSHWRKNKSLPNKGQSHKSAEPALLQGSTESSQGGELPILLKAFHPTTKDSFE